MIMGLVKDTNIKEETPLVDVKFTHSLCIGQTGSGKTTSFIYPNIKNRMDLGHGILFFDIKGSEHLALKKLASDANRLEDVVEIGKPWGENINFMDSLNNRTFASFLQDMVGDPAEAGQNTYFYNEAIGLGKSIFNMLKLKAIISQELMELGKKHYYPVQKDFSLGAFYSVIYNIDTLYKFIQDIKAFATHLHKFIIKYTEYYDSKQGDIYKNIILNYTNINTALKFFKKYDVEASDRGNAEKFETSLLSVISTLSSAFNFMATSSAKYISESENALDIVDALQNGKIIIINVRVIPDTILELMLDQVFEQMIDLNLQSEEEKKPISIFIDEAQRLINKDIPLDVLRSSKVDVLMAVQSEIQLISKFGSREDWQKISVNIAQKFAFKSTYFGGDHLLSFYVETALLETFEYAKEHDSNKLRAIPLFLNKEDFDAVELEYQHDVLKLKEIEKNEILFYDVTHFENEREVVLIDTKTQKKRYRKIFTEFEDDVIQRVLEPYLTVSFEDLMQELQVKDKKSIHSYRLMYDEHELTNSYKLMQTQVIGDYKSYNEVFTLLYVLANEDDDFDLAERVYDIFHSLANDEYDEALFINDGYNEDSDEDEPLAIVTAEMVVINTILGLFEDIGIFIVKKEKILVLHMISNYDYIAAINLIAKIQ
ncbi:type IV secretory system conjugative DNA transfer family protein [Sulfurimonas sp. SAG-AH-194-C21]|nr:TraM recognition domain-containing protein [Sulfurimonas sp. SAG-AH-194-C21]MDF1883633.1 type IV secretory system conjugative DNA transfer family protein [Sulfurimonas sp. SAG-AH-194-C21]